MEVEEVEEGGGKFSLTGKSRIIKKIVLATIIKEER